MAALLQNCAGSRCPFESSMASQLQGPLTKGQGHYPTRRGQTPCPAGCPSPPNTKVAKESGAQLEGHRHPGSHPLGSPTPIARGYVSQSFQSLAEQKHVVVGGGAVMTLPVWLAPFSPLARLARATGNESGRNQSSLDCVTLLPCFSTSRL